MLVQRQATFLPPVSYPLKVSNCVLFSRIIRMSIFVLPAAILRGDPLPRIHRGAACWDPERRLPPAATSNRLRSLQIAPSSMLLLLLIISNTKWPTHIHTSYIFCVHFIHHPIRTLCISCFSPACMLLNSCAALSYQGC